MLPIEKTSVDGSSLPVRAFADHLLLGTGFVDDGAQDAVLEHYLRASLAAVEARTGKAVFRRRFTWTITQWQTPDSQGMPIAPVHSVERIIVSNSLGVASEVAPGSYRLQRNSQRPVIFSVVGNLPAPGAGGTIDIDFTAGLSADWENVPPDLKLAILVLAARFYEARDGDPGGGLPPVVSALIDPYRPVRIGAGMRA